MLKGLQYSFRAMVALSWLVFTCHAALASDPDTVLLLSSDNTYYQETVTSLKQDSENPGRFTTVILDSNAQTDSPLLRQYPHIIAFGSRAAALVIERGFEAKTIVSYLTHEQYQSLGTKQVHSVALLDQPIARYLAFSSALIDNANTGTLLLEDTSIKWQADINQSLRLQTALLASPDRLLSGLRDMLGVIDVFLMTPIRSLYNRNSLRGILLTAYRAGKPVISYSPAHVNSGALGSVYSSPRDISRHLLGLLAAKTTDRQSALNRVEFARYYTIATNARVAASLGIELADEAVIRQRMQELLP